MLFNHQFMRTETYSINFGSLIEGVKKHSPLHLLAMPEDEQIKLFLKTQNFPLEAINILTSHDFFLKEIRNANHNNFIKYIEYLKELPFDQRLENYKLLADEIKTALLIYKITQKFELRTGEVSIEVSEDLNIKKFDDTRNLLLSLIDEMNIDDDDDEADLDPQNAIQKIAFMQSLGVLDLILEKCRYDTQKTTYNISKATNILNTFTGISKDSLKKCLTALTNDQSQHKKNHPFNNLDNEDYVKKLNRYFKL